MEPDVWVTIRKRGRKRKESNHKYTAKKQKSRHTNKVLRLGSLGRVVLSSTKC